MPFLHGYHAKYLFKITTLPGHGAATIPSLLCLIAVHSLDSSNIHDITAQQESSRMDWDDSWVGHDSLEGPEGSTS
jgi:hypothetical protein